MHTSLSPKFASKFHLLSLVLVMTIAIPAHGETRDIETLLLTPQPANANHEKIIVGDSQTPTDTTKAIAQLISDVLNGKTPQQADTSLAKSLSSATPIEQPRIDSVTYSSQGTPRQLKTLFSSKHQLARSLGGDANLEQIASEFLDEYKNILRINNPEEELHLTEINHDELGRHYLRYSQSYQGVPIWPSELIVQFNEHNQVDLVNGHYITTPSQNTVKPVVKQEAAESTAQSAIDVHQLGIEKTELVIHAPIGHQPRLAWKIKLTPTLTSSWTVFVDAFHGTVLKKLSHINHHHVSEPGPHSGSGTDLLGNDAVALNLWYDGSSNYYMIDTSKAMYDDTSTPPNRDSTIGAIIIEDANNLGSTSLPETNIATFSNANIGAGSEQAVSASFTLSQSYDYFNLRHNVKYLVAENESIKAIVNFGSNYDNSFWQPDLKVIVFGNDDKHAASIDIVAHELSHALINKTARLIYENQSGALNEAFADIFGEGAEAHIYGSNDWLIGTELDKPSRNLADPASINIPGTSRPYPATMAQFIEPDDPFLAVNFPDSNHDYGGVHINSTIIGHAFYLLASSTDIADAEKIFYHTLVNQLPSYAQFIDARLGAIASAEQLFGVNSAQALATANAFTSVGILDGEATPPTPAIPQIPASDSTLFIKQSDGHLYTKEPEVAEQNVSSNPVHSSSPSSIVPDTLVRPSVATATTDAGGSSTTDSLALYVVNDTNNLCAKIIGSTSPELCTATQAISAIAIAPKTSTPDDQAIKMFSIAYVLDDVGERNKIYVATITINTDTDTISNINDSATAATMMAPTTDSDISLNVIDKIGQIAFSANGEYIYFNALSEINFADDDGPNPDALIWSIYSYNTTTERVRSVVPPIKGIDFKSVALGHTHDNLLTFTGYSLTGETFIYIADIEAGVAKKVGDAITTPTNAPFRDPYPGFNGNDSAIIYSNGTNLLRQNISTIDHMTAIGQPTTWQTDATLGVIYREGRFHGPNSGPEGSIDSPISADDGDEPDDGIYDIETGDDVVFQGSAADAEGDTDIQYEWRIYDTDDNFIGNAFGDTTNPITFPNAGGFIVRLIATDNFGASDPAPPSITIRVGISNIAPISAITSPSTFSTTIQPGETIQFLGEGNDPDAPLDGNGEPTPPTYSWTIVRMLEIEEDVFVEDPTFAETPVINNADSVQPDPVTFTAEERFKVTLTVTDNQDLSTKAEVTVIVDASTDSDNNQPILNDRQPPKDDGGGSFGIVLLLGLLLAARRKLGIRDYRASA